MMGDARPLTRSGVALHGGPCRERGRPFKIGLQRPNAQTGEHLLDNLGYELIGIHVWPLSFYHNNKMFS